jgi:hypothetical protein
MESVDLGGMIDFTVFSYSRALVWAAFGHDRLDIKGLVGVRG